MNIDNHRSMTHRPIFIPGRTFLEEIQTAIS